MVFLYSPGWPGTPKVDQAGIPRSICLHPPPLHSDGIKSVLPYPDNNKVLGSVEYTERQEKVLYTGSTSLVPSHAPRFSPFPDCHNFSHLLRSPHHHGIHGSTAHHVPSSVCVPPERRAPVPYSSSSPAALSLLLWDSLLLSSACVPSVPSLAPPGPDCDQFTGSRFPTQRGTQTM